MPKQKPLKEEQGVPILVVENWPHNSHLREVPFSNNVKHKASVLGQVTAGDRKIVVCQPPRLWPAELLHRRGTEELYLGKPSTVASKTHW